MKYLKMSSGLSERLHQMNEDGHKLNDDSKNSENTLNEAMKEIIAYAKQTLAPYSVVYEKSISLFSCQTYLPPDFPTVLNAQNQQYYMSPDGGILYALIDGVKYPLLISEDKVQGTNDRLFAEGKKRQATGNAIERAGKNIKAAEMLFARRAVFPYVLFASGCDFHHTETISKRIEMMNMGVPNHYIPVSPDTAILTTDSVINALDIKKVHGFSIVSVCVKAHKWNEMPHGASRWTTEEIKGILRRVLDLSIADLKASLR